MQSEVLFSINGSYSSKFTFYSVWKSSVFHEVLLRNISVTNLQFKITSLEHKTLPLVFHKNTLGHTYDGTEF
jgi:hypothetical protein